MADSNAFEQRRDSVVQALEKIVKDRSITPANRSVARAALVDAKAIDLDFDQKSVIAHLFGMVESKVARQADGAAELHARMLEAFPFLQELSGVT